MNWFPILLQVGLENPNQFSDYLTLGYVLMWAVALLYVVYLWTRQHNVRQDLKLLDRLLKEDEAEDEG